MNQKSIFQFASDNGFKRNHFLGLKDKKSGVVLTGIFTKYKQHETDGLRIKNDNFEVEIISNGQFNFDILQSVEVKPTKLYNTQQLGKVLRNYSMMLVSAIQSQNDPTPQSLPLPEEYVNNLGDIKIDDKSFELTKISKEVISYFDSYNEWMRQYGSHQMTTQKQSFDRLKEKINKLKHFINEIR